MNKKELIESIAGAADISKAAAEKAAQPTTGIGHPLGPADTQLQASSVAPSESRGTFLLHQMEL